MRISDWSSDVCSSDLSCNRPGAGIRMDTVGPPMKGVEVRIAEDGEILVRGELVMYGYWRNDAETARVLKQGWLHRSEEHTSELQSLMRISYAVFCLKKKTPKKQTLK